MKQAAELAAEMAAVLAAVVLVLVVLYAAALELVPWPWPAVLAVPASITTVLAVVLIGAPVLLPDA